MGMTNPFYEAPRIKFKKLSENAIIPKYATEGSNGLDITAIEVTEDPLYTEYKTGLAVELPKGYMGLLVPRSSVSITTLSLANCVGIIDQDFRGEIRFRYRRLNLQMPTRAYNIYERVGQLVIVPSPKFVILEAKELSDTTRGTGGFGSTSN